MDRIDFRSDTVTWPTEAMREAMLSAPLGDDVYGEDPTVNRLQALAAERVGKPAGLFVASGTMGNFCSLLSHAGRGDEAIAGVDAHTLCWEAGAMSAFGGVFPRALATDDQGRMDVGQIEAAVRADDPHFPRSRLVLLENSYGARNGYPLPPSYLAEVAEVAKRHGLRVHLDGARLFNAAVALGCDAGEITQHVDSVSFCLSKGLCAPVGSVLCGSEQFIHAARRARKAVGGGMRQAGVLAAAGLVALETMVERLAEDHARARRLAEGLATLPHVELDTESIRTNIVCFEVKPESGLEHQTLIERLRKEHGVWIGQLGDRLRAVTHYWIGDREVEALLRGVESLLGQP